MRYYIIAGEASGDLHASNLVKGIRKMDPNAEFRGWGGDLMEEAGVHLAKHYRDLAFMGFVEVLANIRTIFSNLKFCKKDILEYKPDAVILVDYPGFNLRIAAFTKSEKIKTLYYISPQVWAWKQSRVHKIKKIVDRMYCILPFEKDFYKKFDYEVDFVGHPLLDAIKNYREEDIKKSEVLSKSDGKRLIALLPGSRKQEIAKMLPIMLSVRKDFADCRFVIGGAPSIKEEFYKELIGDDSVDIVYGKTYALMDSADAALVTSGTATLETALFGVPEVVCYKGSKISYQIARKLIKVKFISLVNLIADKEIVKELIQDDLNTINLKSELNDLLNNRERMGNLERSYQELRENLGGIGASDRTAKMITEQLNERN